MTLAIRNELCAGSCREPQATSTQVEVTGFDTAACAACGGRFRLALSGLVPPHSIPVPLHDQLAAAA
jgi:hypothetical protein